MPVITPPSTTSPGIAVPLALLTDAVIGESVTIVSTTDVGIRGSFTAHDVRVLGVVQGATAGIALGLNLSNSLRNTVLIDHGGLVQAMQSGANFSGVVFTSALSTLTNFGTILSVGTGVTMGGISEASSLIANYGSIVTGGTAILRNLGSTETLKVLNLGIVQSNAVGTRIAFQGGDLLNAVDLFVNRGLVVGNILLGAGNDRYDGRKGIMEGTVFGGLGDDMFLAGRLADTFNGDSGSDTVDFRHLGAVQIALDGTLENLGYAKDDTYTSIENIQGSAIGADTLRGDAGRNLLFGNGGADILDGSGGDDRLIGGLGRDVLTGGAGNDVFVYNSAADGGDTLTDFDYVAGNNDVIWISARGFGGGLKAGEVNPDSFHISTTNRAADKGDRFIFQTVGAKLWFDKDGTGRAKPVLIADLPDTIELSDADLYLI